MRTLNFLFLLFFYNTLYAQTIIWEENFDIYSDGTTTGNLNRWTSTCSACASGDFFEVRSGAFQGRDVNDFSTWESESIDISTHPTISFSLDAIENGDHEGPGCLCGINIDYFDVYYSIDGGVFTVIENWNGDGDIGHTLTGDVKNGTFTDNDWESTTVVQNGLSGSSLIIRVVMRNTSGSENLILDNVSVFSPASPSCPPTTFTVSPNIDCGLATGSAIVTPPISGYSYLWSDPTMQTDSLATNLLPDSTYEVTITHIALPHCDTTISTTIPSIRNPFFISRALTICDGDSILVSGAYQNTTGSYYDTLRALTNGCDSIVETILTINPQFNIRTDSIIICNGDSVLINGIYRKDTGTYNDTIEVIVGCDSIIITHLVNSPTYNINIDTTICQGDSIIIKGVYQHTSGTYIDTLSTYTGCDSIITTRLTVAPTPISSQNIIDTSIYLGHSVQLEVTGAPSYLWTPSDGLSCSSCSSPLVTPLENTQYTILLTSNEGCTISTTITIEVMEKEMIPLEIPTAITPNGDGYNDTWEIIGIENYPNATIMLFNRWGKMIFESRSNYHEHEWKGDAPIASYFYIIDLKNGSEKQTGSVTIIK